MTSRTIERDLASLKTMGALIELLVYSTSMLVRWIMSPFLRASLISTSNLYLSFVANSVQIPSSEDVPKRDSLIFFLACEILHLLTGTFDVD